MYRIAIRARNTHARYIVTMMSSSLRHNYYVIIVMTSQLLRNRQDILRGRPRRTFPRDTGDD